MTLFHLKVTTLFLVECLVLAQGWILYQPPSIGRSSPSDYGSTCSSTTSNASWKVAHSQSHHTWKVAQPLLWSPHHHPLTATTTLYAKKNSKEGKSKNRKTPKLIIFDLDGCLWSPEMYEILYFMGGLGSPFTTDDQDPRILRTAGGSKVRLLGNVREIFHDLQYDEQWWNTLVGISSKTDQPEWARELLEKFIIFDTDSTNETYAECPSFPMKQVFTPEICELAQDPKVQHFERILQNSPGKPKYQDCIFFDNELGNCRQVAKLGVTVCYCPNGVTKSDWDAAIANFPRSNGKVIGK